MDRQRIHERFCEECRHRYGALRSLSRLPQFKLADIRRLTTAIALFLFSLTLPLGSSWASPTDEISVKSVAALKGRLLFSAEIEGDQKIIFTDLATGKSSILVDSVGQDWFPVFHPEGKEIIFMSDRTGSKSLYRMNYEGNGEKRVSPRGSEVGNPSWVPDSKKRVAFYYREDGGPQKTNLFSLDLTTGAEQRITNFDGRNSTPKPAPNGEVVAYSTNQFWPGWDVCLYTIRTKANVCPLKGIDSFCRPAWNSAGTKILYSVGAGDSIALGEYDVAADSRTILSAPTGKSYDAQYVGNNSFIFANNQAGSFDLYFQEKDKISVIVESKYDLRYPSWHPSTVMEMEVERLRSQKNPK